MDLPAFYAKHFAAFYSAALIGDISLLLPDADDRKLRLCSLLLQPVHPLPDPLIQCCRYFLTQHQISQTFFLLQTLLSFQVFS